MRLEASSLKNCVNPWRALAECSSQFCYCCYYWEGLHKEEMTSVRWPILAGPVKHFRLLFIFIQKIQMHKIPVQKWPHQRQDEYKSDSDYLQCDFRDICSPTRKIKTKGCDKVQCFHKKIFRLHCDAFCEEANFFGLIVKSVPRSSNFEECNPTPLLIEERKTFRFRFNLFLCYIEFCVTFCDLFLLRSFVGKKHQ